MEIKSKSGFFLPLVIFALSIFFIFWRISVPELNDWDEGIYASISGDMAKNNTLVMKLQGVNWHEKEPLGFIFMALSQKVFGYNELAVRLPSALFTIFIPLFLYLISLFLMKKVWAFGVAIFFLFSPTFWDRHIARTGDFDMIFATLFLLSIFLWLRFRENKKKLMYAAAAIAMAFLVRGVFAILPLLIILVMEFFWFWKKTEFGFLEFIKKYYLFVVIAFAPWLIWQIFSIAIWGMDFIKIYWVEQTVQRVYLPLQGHGGGWGYYIDYWISRNSIITWIGFFGIVLSVYFSILKKNFENIFVLVWFMVCFVAIELTSTKLYWYGIPTLLGLYIAGGLAMQEIKNQIFERTHESKQLIKYIFLFFSAVLVVNILIWVTALSVEIRKLRTSTIQNLSQHIKNNIPAHGNDTNLVVYKIAHWNFGKILPSWYWYLSVKNNEKIKLIETKENRDYYAARFDEFKYWLVDDFGLKELQVLLGKDRVELEYKEENLILAKIR